MPAATTAGAEPPPTGPLDLVLGVADLGPAGRLWTDLLGGEPVTSEGAQSIIHLAPELDLILEASEVSGPRRLTVATDRPDAVRAACSRLGLVTSEDGDAIVLEDRRFGGGHLRFLPTRSSREDGGSIERTVAGPPRGAVGLRRADHVCFAVEDLRIGAEVLEAAGGWPVLGGDGPAGARALVLRFPHLKVEMLAPTDPDGPVARHLARREGRSGIHHLTLFVEDVDSAVAALTTAGIPTVDTDTTTRSTWHETFLRPGATDGLLIQLARTTVDHRDRLTDEQIADIHAGRYSAVDYLMRRRGADKGGPS